MGHALLKHELSGYDAWKTTPPEPDNHAARVAEWIENGVEQLLRCEDVEFKRRLHGKQGVTFKQFAAEVEQYTLTTACTNPAAIGEMVIGALVQRSGVSRDGAIDLMAVPDPLEQLRIIARGLLAPLAADGLIAQDEENAP